MVDQDLYNYVKNALGQRKSREEIVAALAQGGWTQADVDLIFSAVQSGSNSQIATSSSEERPSSPDRYASIALALGVMSLLPWFSRLLMSFSQFLYYSTYTAMILAIVGIFFALLGFKTQKMKAILALLLCLINIIPGIVLTTLLYEQGEIGKTYDFVDFAIKVPFGWTETTPSEEMQGVRALFLLRGNADTYAPRIHVTSISDLEALDTEGFDATDADKTVAFGKGGEDKLREDSSIEFISGKFSEWGGQAFYVLNYKLEVEGKKVLVRTVSLVYKDMGYHISASAEDATFQRYSSQINAALLSFKPK